MKYRAFYPVVRPATSLATNIRMSHAFAQLSTSSFHQQVVWSLSEHEVTGRNMARLSLIASHQLQSLFLSRSVSMLYRDDGFLASAGT